MATPTRPVVPDIYIQGAEPHMRFGGNVRYFTSDDAFGLWGWRLLSAVKTAVNAKRASFEPPRTNIGVQYVVTSVFKSLGEIAGRKEDANAFAGIEFYASNPSENEENQGAPQLAGKLYNPDPNLTPGPWLLSPDPCP